MTRLFEVLVDASVPENVKELALRVDFNPKAAGSASKMTHEKAPAWKSLVALGAESAAAASLAPAREMLSRILHETQAKLEGQGVSQRCIRFRSSQGMPRWPGSVNPSCADAEGKRKLLEQANWDWLTEPDNSSSLRLVVAGWKADVERSASHALELEAAAAAKLQCLQSFSDTMQASQCAPIVSAIVADPPPPQFAKYGSKIETLVKHVLKLQAKDASCKSICFVQWEDLKRKIGSALTEFGIDHLSLHGSVWKRRAALMKFQYEADSPRILLLSLEESASGTNLTAANHVLIVHPMEAATRDEAVAFEMQAIGRVRRPGQQRKIHIWRFVTEGTVEQDITEEHQNELWERQQSALMLTQAIMETQELDLGRMEPEAAEEEHSTQLYAAPQPWQSSEVAQCDLLSCGAEDSATQRYATDPPLGGTPPSPPSTQPEPDAMADSCMVDTDAETLCFAPAGMRSFPPVPAFSHTEETMPQPVADDCTQQY